MSYRDQKRNREEQQVPKSRMLIERRADLWLRRITQHDTFGCVSISPLRLLVSARYGLMIGVSSASSSKTNLHFRRLVVSLTQKPTNRTADLSLGDMAASYRDKSFDQRLAFEHGCDCSEPHSQQTSPAIRVEGKYLS